jgi:DNA-binding IscR family transcriptional regulator
MNATPLEQSDSSIDEFIFGDQQLHLRFSTAIELLARMVVANPRAVSASALAETLGQPVRMVRTVLDNLGKSGLVRQDDKVKDGWCCTSALTNITLADIFRAVASIPVPAPGALKRKGEPVATVADRSASQQSVDLLLMQATMAINQVVLQHLQQFDLGRLRALTSAAAFRPPHAAIHSWVAEPC